MAIKKWKLIDKKAKKQLERKCYFCDVDDYACLNVHRILPGEEGGIYSEFNSICTCSNHHALIHSGQIKIDRKYYSSSGKWVLHYWDLDGVEHWD